jgi:OmpA-OmpF porin, OOP family
MRTRWPFGVVPLLSLLASAWSLTAAAQQAQPALALDRLHLAPAGDRFFVTASPYAAGHMQLHASLLAEYRHDPLVLRNGDEQVGSIVEHQLLAHLDVTLALLERLTFNVEAPFALAQYGDDPAGFVSPSAAQIGDLRLGVRGSLVGEQSDFFQLALGAYFWAATAPSEPGSYLGSGAVRAKPYVSMGGHALRFVWGLELGPEFRESQDFLGVEQGTLLELGLANGVLLGADRRIQLSLELAGALTPADVRVVTTNFEALGGAKWRFTNDLVAAAAGGLGLFVSGIGTPDLRAMLGIAYTPGGWMAPAQARLPSGRLRF